MSWPGARFTAAAEPDAVVRLDLNADPQAGAWCRLVHDDFNLGAPELQGDPDSVATELGLRQLTMTVRIAGSRAEAMALQSRLARELGRHRNWLSVQLSPLHKRVWFHTYRSQPGELSFEYIANSVSADIWQVTLSIYAEAYAYGERVTASAATIPNDPTAATGCRVTLPAIVGDAPTPLRVRARVSGSQVQSTQQGMVGSRWMLGVAAFPSRRDRALVDLNAATLVAGAGGVKESDAAYSGGSGVKVTVPTGTSSTRVTGSAPALPHGRWRVLLRAVRRTAGAAASAAWVEFGGGSAPVRSRQVPLWAAGAGGAQAAWFDLGTVQTPLRTVVPDDLLATGTSSPALAVHLATGGQGDIGLDAVMFIPADDAADGRGSVCLTEFGDPAPTTSASATSGDRTFWDGDAETVFRQPQVTASQWGAPDSLTAQVAGTYVEAHPGLVNDLYVMHHVRDAATARVSATGDVLGASTEVVVSYRPRWLWLGDGS